jgi:Fe-S cluster assembly protein SufD
VSQLSPDVSAALDDPQWLRSHRADAAGALAAATRPSVEQEIWRYSRIGERSLDDLQPAPPSAATPPPANVLAAFSEPAAVAVMVNGRLISCELDPGLRNKGVRLGPLAGAEDGPSQLGRVVGHSEDPLVLANEAFAVEPLLLSVPDGVQVDAPVVVVDWTATGGAAAFSRLVVRAEAGAQLDVVHLQGGDAAGGWLVPLVELSAGNDARLRYSVVQDLSATTWQTATVVAEAHQQANLEIGAAALGGDYARLRLDCRLVGRGATGKLAALYFGDGQQMLDFRTLQDHRAPDCTSDLMFKGVVDDRSHSVYSGMIRVRPDARGTNAFQTNRNIKLSDDAWAESVPNLEIENNDVRCSHASAVGPIDIEQRFYLESRGVPTRRAEQLIVAGFLQDVAVRMPDGVRRFITDRVADKLGETAGGREVA